ncbi:hypothetical protein WJX72_001859 [[Myrmecia] bisecta]|uniref:Ubiquitin carboxyl-terminal hydrolase n=1 Tax=[Myrmecia] bisecta TaxID=41462 RepID=A0AAW1PH92_9CHLO
MQQRRLVGRADQIPTPATVAPAPISLAADELDRLAVRVEPRGLTNTGNICFMNSILQALMAGSSFCYFMQTLKAAAPALDDPKLPTLRAFSALASELKTTPLAAEANGVLAAADSRPGSSKAGAAGKAPAKPAGSEKGVAEQTGFSALSQETPAGDETPEVTEASAASEPESETSAQPSQSASASGYKVSGQGSKREGPPPSNGGASSGAVAGTAWGVASGSSAAQQSGSTAQQLGGRELLPDMMFPIVSRFNPSNARPAPVSPPAKQTMAERMKQGRGGAVQREQEDAQEFLTHLLEKSHEELLELKARHMPHEAGQPAKPEQSEEWSEVQKGGSKKNRSAVTRGSEEVQGGMTLTSGIFGGSTRSVVKAASAPQPSITNQPFNVLHLEILHSDVASLADALSRHCAPETIEDYKWKDGVEGATATKTVTLLRLPQILVIHLMRFSYGLTGTGKVHKALRFDTTLRMQRAWVSDKCPMQGAEYELIATVSHHGRTPASGHYTADVRQPNDKWLRFDDANVYSVTVPKVLAEPVYLLFYQLKRPVRQ